MRIQITSLSHLIQAFSERDSYLDHLAVKRIINNRGRPTTSRGKVINKSLEKRDFSVRLSTPERSQY